VFFVQEALDDPTRVSYSEISLQGVRSGRREFDSRDEQVLLPFRFYLPLLLYGGAGRRDARGSRKK